MAKQVASFLAIGVVIAVAAIAGAAFISTRATLDSISTTQSSSSITQIVSNLPTNDSSTPLPGIGLSLQLSLNASVMTPNDSIHIDFSDFNTLNMNNTLPRSNNFSLPSILDWWGCRGDFIYFAIFPGYYTLSNITGAAPLPNSLPGEPCPPSDYQSVQFQSKSNVVIVNGSPGGPATLHESYSIPGYYNWSQVLTNGSYYTILHFKQGIYTVVVGDEWGDLAMAYFEVIG